MATNFNYRGNFLQKLANVANLTRLGWQATALYSCGTCQRANVANPHTRARTRTHVFINPLAMLVRWTDY